LKYFSLFSGIGAFEEEKYGRGGISQEEWDKIYNKYFELEW